MVTATGAASTSVVARYGAKRRPSAASATRISSCMTSMTSKSGPLAFASGWSPLQRLEDVLEGHLLVGVGALAGGPHPRRQLGRVRVRRLAIRSTALLATRPTTPSVPGRARLANTVPMRMSGWPLQERSVSA